MYKLCAHHKTQLGQGLYAPELCEATSRHRLAKLASHDINVALGANSNELYQDETLGRDLPKTVYILDATTIDL